MSLWGHESGAIATGTNRPRAEQTHFCTAKRKCVCFGRNRSERGMKSRPWLLCRQTE